MQGKALMPRIRRMMRAFFALAIAAGLASCAVAPVKAPSAGASVKASLGAFADAFDRAQLTKDRESLERMVSDDLVFIDGSGRRQGKKEFIDGWTGPGDRYDPVTLIDRVILPIGPDAGVVSAETVLSGTSGGQRFSSRFRFSDTFQRTGGQWRAVHVQVTRMP
jgi:ketosteroid isomerase-like protein